MSMTIGDILALEGLGALRLRAGARSLHAPVRWYYVAENEGIADWVMGGELVFVTGINHPRDETNLLQLLREGRERGIAGMVVLTGPDFIRAIPPAAIALANTLNIALVEQPYQLKMVIVTELIATALVRRDQLERSRRDMLLQLLTGDYPDVEIIRQRARSQNLDLSPPLRVVAFRLTGAAALFRDLPGEAAEAHLQQARQLASQRLQVLLGQLDNPFPLLVTGQMFIMLLPEPGLSRHKRRLQQWLQEGAEDSREPLALLCGASSVVSDLHHWSNALAEARRALDVVAGLAPRQRLCDYDQLGVIKLLSAVGDRALLADFARDTLGRLIEPARRSPYLLVETLEALIQENGNALRAAERLSIHRNTLHQRLQRIEQQSGHTLDDPQFRLDAAVALLIWRMSQTNLQES